MINTPGNHGGIHKCNMPLLKLRGKNSKLILHLEQPIHLEENVKHRIALVAFFSDNNIYNVRDDVNISFWDRYVLQVPTPLTFTKGYWTIESIEAKTKQFITSLQINIDASKFKLSKSGNYLSIFSPLKFYLDSNACALFGFEIPTTDNYVVGSYYKENQIVTGTRPPKLRTVDAIEVHCNVVQHSLVNHDTHYHKHAETELLYTFFPEVPHGYKISEQPKERLYVDVKPGLHTIHNIIIKIQDQDNNLVINDDVENLVYLDLVSY